MLCSSTYCFFWYPSCYLLFFLFLSNKVVINSKMASNQLIAFLVIVLTLLLHGNNMNTVVEAQLSQDFYFSTCPNLIRIVQTAVRNNILLEPRMGASILRLFYLDCFVNVSRLFSLKPKKHCMIVSCSVLLIISKLIIQKGMWRFDSTRWYTNLHGRTKRGRKPQFCSRVWCHRQHQIKGWESMSRGRVLLWYLSPRS